MPRATSFALLTLLFLNTGCITSMLPGSVDRIQPTSDQPRRGNVYLIRGWGGMFSWGIDDLSRAIDSAGIRAQVFQHDQRNALARTLVDKYRGVEHPEPLCIVAHSAGSDDAIFIARALRSAGITVDLLVTLDGVDESVIPRNVRLTRNYWMPGAWGDSNFLRGIPFTQEPGVGGKLVNINLHEEGRDLCAPARATPRSTRTPASATPFSRTCWRHVRNERLIKVNRAAAAALHPAAPRRRTRRFPAEAR